MSSDEEYDLNYGIDDDCQNTFHKSKEESFYQNNFDEEDDENGLEKSVNEFNIPKYDHDVNSKLKARDGIECDNIETVGDSGESNHQLDDFMELLETQNDASNKLNDSVENKEVQKKNQVIKKPPEDSNEGILTEKSSGIRVVKSTFSSDVELNTRLSSDYGQYFRLTELMIRQDYLKKNQNTIDWFTVAVVGSKTDSKCSAKGNNYIIWHLFDLNNLEREQEISLFLFGNAYKKFWKSSEFEVFAITKPDFFDDPKSSNTTPATKTINFNNQKATAKTAKAKQAAKRFSLSVRNENQLVPLGFAKDIVVCQSYKKTQVGANERNTEASQRCKNLVNLRVSKYCIYHCKKLDSTFKMEKFGNKKQVGKNAPFGNRSEFGQMNEQGYQTYSPKIKLENLPVKSSASKYQMTGRVNSNSNEVNKPFVENPQSNSSIIIKSLKKEKELIKNETLLSLNYNPHDSSLLPQMMFKSQKASDRELLAKLKNENIDDAELKNLRKAGTLENMNNEVIQQSNKEIKSLFNSKALLPNATNCNNSISAKKLVELKSSLATFANIDKSQEERKAYNLASMSSHRDIMKEIKKGSDGSSDKKKDEEPVRKVEKFVIPSQSKPSIKASDFLKQHVQDISSQTKKNQALESPKVSVSAKKPPISNDFELEIYIGEEKTSKKLMDNIGSPQNKILTPKNSSAMVRSPLVKETNTENKKRKLDQVQDSPGNSAGNEKEKKLKLIDELMNIKSKFSKDANDPEKNAHLKSYLDRLEEKESVENRLSSIKRKEVRVVTCNICKYTSFTQSDLCKSKRHDISRHMAVQRYFKCKNCSKRTYTLDKVCPVSACVQCGSDKFEQCGMKNEIIETSLIQNAILPD